MFEAKVRELMAAQYDYGQFDEAEAREIVKEAMDEYSQDPGYYDDLDEAIEIIAHDRMYIDC